MLEFSAPVIAFSERPHRLTLPTAADAAFRGPPAALSARTEGFPEPTIRALHIFDVHLDFFFFGLPPSFPLRRDADFCFSVMFNRLSLANSCAALFFVFIGSICANCSFDKAVAGSLSQDFRPWTLEQYGQLSSAFALHKSRSGIRICPKLFPTPCMEKNRHIPARKIRDPKNLSHAHHLLLSAFAVLALSCYVDFSRWRHSPSYCSPKRNLRPFAFPAEFVNFVHGSHINPCAWVRQQQKARAAQIYPSGPR